MLQEEAFTRLIHRDSVFLTGAPGSGKSFLLGRFTNHLKIEETPFDDGNDLKSVYGISVHRDQQPVP